MHGLSVVYILQLIWIRSYQMCEIWRRPYRCYLKSNLSPHFGSLGVEKLPLFTNVLVLYNVWTFRGIYFATDFRPLVYDVRNLEISELKMKVLSARADLLHTTVQQIISRRGY